MVLGVEIKTKTDTKTKTNFEITRIGMPKDGSHMQQG
jgi:hypothetical protein